MNAYAIEKCARKPVAPLRPAPTQQVFYIPMAAVNLLCAIVNYVPNCQLLCEVTL
jgi:hypothetical protein